MGLNPTRGSSFFSGIVTALGVLCCFNLQCCLFNLASFFLPSFLPSSSLFNVCQGVRGSDWVGSISSVEGERREGVKVRGGGGDSSSRRRPGSASSVEEGGDEDALEWVNTCTM